ncbi:hypothetical protein DERF_010120 [Dermatophagoides farinae]|uniref:Uncharacterized protein n=1 Tax=Dermatophagoides farinae TaxID=6954 RepID=A0A922HZE5_DERFA|nr:hypothetical protein DERF_010120 [Dermatophagoides farinae]
MVPQLPLYPLVQQELNSIARRIIVVEEIPTAIQHWYRLYENWDNIRDMVPQLPLYPLVQQELNSIARRIIVVEEIPTAIQHWYRLYGNSPRYITFRITSSYVKIS